MPKISKEARSPGILTWFRGKYSPSYNLAITMRGIVIAEAIAMVVVYFYRSLPYYHQVILNAAVMTVIILPLRIYRMHETDMKTDSTGTHPDEISKPLVLSKGEGYDF